MGSEEAVCILGESLQQGVHYPEALQGTLSLSEVYEVQRGVLRRAVASGAKHAGWKIGVAADAIRSVYQVKEPERR